MGLGRVGGSSSVIGLGDCRPHMHSGFGASLHVGDCVVERRVVQLEPPLHRRRRSKHDPGRSGDDRTPRKDASHHLAILREVGGRGCAPPARDLADDSRNLTDRFETQAARQR